LIRVNKKTRKREKYLDNIKKAHRKKKKKDKAPQFNFSALHLIHDPQVPYHMSSLSYLGLSEKKIINKIKLF
jgi:hypothetical protein